MAEITYLPKGDLPATNEWGAYTFEANKPLEVTDKHIIKKAKDNPYFKVVEDEEAEVVSEENDTPFDRGAQAARDGKSRNAPGRWASNKKGEEWLKGYDSVEDDKSEHE